MKENTAYGTDHLATVSSHLGEHEEVCERKETTPDYEDGYEDVSQVWFCNVPDHNSNFQQIMHTCVLEQTT